MKFLDGKRSIKIFFLLALLLAVSGCGQITGDSNYSLDEGERVVGPLVLFSNNAVLEKDSFVDGSVIMVCCNLKVEGSVSGDVLLLTGNLWVSPIGDVDGDVKVISGNLTR